MLLQEIKWQKQIGTCTGAGVASSCALRQAPLILRLEDNKQSASSLNANYTIFWKYFYLQQIHIG